MRPSERAFAERFPQNLEVPPPGSRDKRGVVRVGAQPSPEGTMVQTDVGRFNVLRDPRVPYKRQSILYPVPGGGYGRSSIGYLVRSKKRPGQMRIVPFRRPYPVGQFLDQDAKYKKLLLRKKLLLNVLKRWRGPYDDPRAGGYHDPASPPTPLGPVLGTREGRQALQALLGRYSVDSLWGWYPNLVPKFDWRALMGTYPAGAHPKVGGPSVHAPTFMEWLSQPKRRLNLPVGNLTHGRSINTLVRQWPPWRSGIHQREASSPRQPARMGDIYATGRGEGGGTYP